MSQYTAPSCHKVNFKAKESPEPEATTANCNGSLSSVLSSQKTRAKSVPPDVKKDSKVQRSLMVANRSKSEEQKAGSLKGRENIHEDVRIVGRSVKNPINGQFSKTKRVRALDLSTARRNEEEGRKELLDKLELNENLVQDLQAEVLSLKAKLDKSNWLNKELELRNKKLIQDLAAAEAKVAALNTNDQDSIGEEKNCQFKEIQKLIANKLKQSPVKKEAINGKRTVKTPQAPPPPSSLLYSMSRANGVEGKDSTFPSLPPPPPPPLPPMRPLARAAATPKTPPIVEFYNSLIKRKGNIETIRVENQYRPVTTSVHCSIVGEIQNRSAHLLAIRADIETKGDFINGLIKKVLAASYTDIEDVLKFVDWLDGQLSSLADERAVLKHFDWPEKKEDAIREAAIEYRSLKLLESDISSYKDDNNIPCGTALKKMAVLLDKSEQSIQRLIKLRNSVMHSYHAWRIPTDWMLDSGIMSKIKKASMMLAKMYMKRVITELELYRDSDKESNQEALLLQGVNFAYRAHQFVGGLDSETLCAFKEIRQLVPGHVGGSRELLVAIPSS